MGKDVVWLFQEEIKKKNKQKEMKQKNWQRKKRSLILNKLNKHKTHEVNLKFNLKKKV